MIDGSVSTTRNSHLMRLLAFLDRCGQDGNNIWNEGTNEAARHDRLKYQVPIMQEAIASGKAEIENGLMFTETRPALTQQPIRG